MAHENQKTVYVECYLVVGASHVDVPRRYIKLSTPKCVKHRPKLGANEISLGLKIELPTTLFVRPQIEAKIAIPEDSVVPPTVNMEVIDNIEEIANSQGLKLVIEAPHQADGGVTC